MAASSSLDNCQRSPACPCGDAAHCVPAQHAARHQEFLRQPARPRGAVSHPGAKVRTLTNGPFNTARRFSRPNCAKRRPPTTPRIPASVLRCGSAACAEMVQRATQHRGHRLGVGTSPLTDKPATASTSTRSTRGRAIAQNLFTYLRDSAAQTSIAEGDGRSTLAVEAPQNFDVLIVDAFSGDAIPLHLLTTQAVDLYKRHSLPRHPRVSHLESACRSRAGNCPLGQYAGMESRRVSSREMKTAANSPQPGCCLAPTHPSSRSRGRPACTSRATNASLQLWTDDYSSLFPLLR